MTIYQPNDDARPTGAEVDEFVDTPQPAPPAPDEEEDDDKEPDED